MSLIKGVKAREILDSRGYPTIETEIVLESGFVGVASVPSGASTGSFEAVELRDGDKRRFLGKGVLKAVDNVNTVIRKKIVGMDAIDQGLLDRTLIELDGTENKAKLGANSILSVSIAAARASSSFFSMPLYRYIGGISNCSRLPKPMMNILNGGAHADNNIDIQEFMIVPVKEAKFNEYVMMCSTVYHTLRQDLKSKGLNTNSGDEGGVAPNLSGTHEALDYIVSAIEMAGYKPGVDLSIALDAAASELYVDKMYCIEKESKTSQEMVSYYEELVKNYPIISIEDPLHEEDWDSWELMNSKLGQKIQIIGDDLYVTNIKRLAKGINIKASNAILIKPNQIGTLTETLETINYARKHGYNIIISHRSGETCDTTISDIAVGVSAEYIKTGAPTRGERVAKYNRLMQIMSEVGG
ncbi:MAG: phosphopyruvate hydratase [Holosporales bacterium]|nr:phosphopyruvate hydratase [Holosporales bacterium]